MYSIKSITLPALFVTMLAANACSSSEEVKEIDTKLESKGSVDGKQIGINEDDEAIIQENTNADDELRSLQWANSRLLEQLETDHHELKRCREDLADPRLGGSGEVRDLPEIDNMKPVTEVKEEFGKDADGNLKVVKRESFVKAVAAEKKYQKTLKSMQQTVEKNRVECERNMRQVRAKHGLPAQRYKAEGYFKSDGTWVETRPAEVTLDDAFSIKGRAAGKAKAEEPAGE
jgi:hypothetical protein